MKHTKKRFPNTGSETETNSDNKGCNKAPYDSEKRGEEVGKKTSDCTIPCSAEPIRSTGGMIAGG